MNALKKCGRIRKHLRAAVEGATQRQRDNAIRALRWVSLAPHDERTAFSIVRALRVVQVSKTPLSGPREYVVLADDCPPKGALVPRSFAESAVACPGGDL